MDPLFVLDPNVANTIITAISTLIAGVIGGLIGSRATRSATERALEHALARDEANRLATLRGVLRGIRTELEIMWAAYKAVIGDLLDSINQGDPLELTLPITQEYFQLYKANAGLIGQIEDDELRRRLISAQFSVQRLVEAHAYNNQLLARHYELTKRRADAGEKDYVIEELNACGYQVKLCYQEASENVRELYKVMDQSPLLTTRASNQLRT